MIEEQRIQAILQIRLDGAETWDVEAFVADKERAGEEPWKITGEPLSQKQVLDYIREADHRIATSSPDAQTAAARHLAMRRSLYARAVQAGEIRAALAILVDIAKIEEVYPAKAKEKTTAGMIAAPGMSWVLIGIPAARFGEIAEEIELLGAVDGIRIEMDPEDGCAGKIEAAQDESES